jgi:hypothetical protein
VAQKSTDRRPNEHGGIIIGQTDEDLFRQKAPGPCVLCGSPEPELIGVWMIHNRYCDGLTYWICEDCASREGWTMEVERKLRARYRIKTLGEAWHETDSNL